MHVHVPVHVGLEISKIIHKDGDTGGSFLIPVV